MARKFKKPQVGYVAWHKAGLDPRHVADVSSDGEMIRLNIFGHITDWVPADNYEYRED